MIDPKNNTNDFNDFENIYDENLEINSFFSFLIRNKQILFLFSSISFFISIILALLSERIWEGEFQIVLSNDSLTNEKFVNNAKARQLFQIQGIDISNDGIKTEVEILKSPSVLMPIFEYVNKNKSPSKNEIIKSNFKDWRKNSLEVNLQRGTNVLNINYKDNNKDLILNVLNQISTTYQSYAISKRTKNINNAMNYLNEQISIYKIKSQESYKSAFNFGLENDINTNIAAANESNILNNETLRIKSENKLIKTRELVKRLDQIPDNSSEIKYIGSNIINPITGLYPFQQDINILNQIEENIVLKKLIYKDNDKAIKDLELSKNIKYKLLKNKIYGFLNEELNIALITKEKSKKPKEIIFKYKQLVRDAQRDENTLNKVLNEKNLLALEKAKQEKPWDLITTPTLMNNPVSPKRKRMVLIGLLFGLGIGSTLSTIRELSHRIIFDKDSLKKLLNKPELMTLASDNLSSWDNPLFLYSRNIFKKNIHIKYLNIVTIGNINIELINHMKDKIISNLNKSKFSIEINALDLKENTNQIIVAQLGRVNIEEIKSVREKLLLQDSKVEGLIILDNKNYFYTINDFINSTKKFVYSFYEKATKLIS